jgi:hypothetical protein
MAYILLLESASILAFLFLARAGAVVGTKFCFSPFSLCFSVFRHDFLCCFGFEYFLYSLYFPIFSFIIFVIPKIESKYVLLPRKLFILRKYIKLLQNTCRHNSFYTVKTLLNCSNKCWKDPFASLF